ncbi:MAG: malate dehydrogenase [Vibrionaceae bacterium]
MKIAVIGAAGGIGQALALLLKNYLPANCALSLYDIAPVTPGVAADLSHIPTPVSIQGFSGEALPAALEGADIALICAGVARKPGMDRSDLFNVNAGIIKSITETVARSCPKAMIGIITNPVNSMVPIAAKVLKAHGVYDKRRLFGITTLDLIRAQTFVSELKGLDLRQTHVPVIGGHSGTTILPLLSQVTHAQFSEEEAKALTLRIQNAGTEVVQAKAGGGSATLSMGQAACQFCLSLVRALQGEQGIVEYAFVESDGQYAPFFAHPIKLGKNGLEQILEHGNLNAYEQESLQNMLKTLRADIEQGELFIK